MKLICCFYFFNCVLADIDLILLSQAQFQLRFQCPFQMKVKLCLGQSLDKLFCDIFGRPIALPFRFHR